MWVGNRFLFALNALHCCKDVAGNGTRKCASSMNFAGKTGRRKYIFLKFTCERKSFSFFLQKFIFVFPNVKKKCEKFCVLIVGKVLNAFFNAENCGLGNEVAMKFQEKHSNYVLREKLS